MRLYAFALFVLAMTVLSAYCFGQALSVGILASATFLICWISGLLLLVVLRNVERGQFGTVAP